MNISFCELKWYNAKKACCGFTVLSLLCQYRERKKNGSLYICERMTTIESNKRKWNTIFPHSLARINVRIKGKEKQIIWRGCNINNVWLMVSGEWCRKMCIIWCSRNSNNNFLFCMNFVAAQTIFPTFFSSLLLLFFLFCTQT